MNPLYAAIYQGVKSALGAVKQSYYAPGSTGDRPDATFPATWDPGSTPAGGPMTPIGKGGRQTGPKTPVPWWMWSPPEGSATDWEADPAWSLPHHGADLPLSDPRHLRSAVLVSPEAYSNQARVNRSGAYHPFYQQMGRTGIPEISNPTQGRTDPQAYDPTFVERFTRGRGRYTPYDRNEYFDYFPLDTAWGEPGSPSMGQFVHATVGTRNPYSGRTPAEDEAIFAERAMGARIGTDAIPGYTGRRYTGLYNSPWTNPTNSWGSGQAINWQQSPAPKPPPPKRGRF